jgi:4-amino-4-deoxychorismate lyase
MPPQSPLRDGSPAGFGLIETLRWEPGAGFLRLDRHLARLERSARELGFVFAKPAVEKALEPLGESTGPLRVRLTLAVDGTAEASAQPFIPLPPDAVWTLAIATVRLDAGDPLLRHKTTRRAAYETARAEFPGTTVDEVILLNQRGEVCEGTITTLFVDPGDGGQLLTPALSCGLLDGVLRVEMIDPGRARETVLRPDDLWRAKALFVGNSLRGLIRARLAPEQNPPS